MKKCFEYIGLISLTLFSFYYTDKMTNIINKSNPVMVEIENSKELLDKNCAEGYISNNEVVLGTPGKEVNVYESYSNMQGKEYDKDKIVFSEIPCKVNLESVKDEFIIGASKDKNAIAIFIIMDDVDNFKVIKNIFDQYSIKINILVNGKIISQNSDYIEELYKDGYYIDYIDNGEEDFNLYLKYYNKLSNEGYCITYEDNSMNYCSYNKFKKVKTKYYYYNNVFLNTKTNLENGSFYIYKSNKNTVKDIPLIINYLRAKNIEILPINVLFK